MIIFVRFAKLDTRHAAGGVKVINLASNFGSLFTALQAGYVLVGVGLISAVASILGHYLGAGLAIKNGSKIVRPTVIAVLLLLTEGRQRAFIPGILELRCVICVRKRLSVF